jgi:hypothetical protein
MQRSIFVTSFFATVAALAVGAACSTVERDKAPSYNVSAEGESCTRSADCAAELTCVQNVCSPSGTAPDGGARPTGSGGSGSTSSPLGGEGESCARRADCQSGLSCILQTCTRGGSSVTPDGGPGEPVPTLGIRGESCQSVRDCAEGLTCVPRTGVSGGVCDLEEYGLEPTGNVCGAECKTAADCCELPPNTLVFDSVSAISTPVSSCADIVQVLLGGDPAVCTATPSAALDAPCFYYKTYCECAAKTWGCTDNKCVYGAKCTHNGDVSNGCPTRTRTGTLTRTVTCDTTAGTCGASAGGCTTAADCVGDFVFDDVTDTCEKGECACVDTKCYRKCDEDLDCAARSTCDTDKSVCVFGGACKANTECATQLRDVRAECRTGKCVLPCGSDHDCGGSGLTQSGGTFNGVVCSKKGVCAPLGCASDAECTTTGGIPTFCTAPLDTTAATISSAITD